MARFEVRPARAEEVSGVLAMEDWLSQPGFAAHMCRVGVLNDEIVAYALTMRRTLQYGRQRLRVIGIGDVFTQPAHRGRGYAKQLLQNTLTYVIEQGAHLALLRDTVGYFARFGFYPVWPEYYLIFDAAQAAALTHNITLRNPKRTHIPAMAALYNRHWGLRVTYTRSPEQWVWRVLGSTDRHCVVALDTAGEVIGYIAGVDLLGEGVEIVVDTLEAATALIAEAGRLHQANGYDTVRWLVPPDDVLVSFARGLLDVQQSAHYHQQSGWMARVMDMPALIDTLLPEITAQAAATLPNFNPDALHITAGSDHVRVALAGDRSTVCKITQGDFVQLVFGSLTPGALATRTPLTPESVRLLGGLFPPRVAALGHWDWF